MVRVRASRTSRAPMKCTYTYQIVYVCVPIAHGLTWVNKEIINQSHLSYDYEQMPEYKYKVYVNARFEVIWQKLLDKIENPGKYSEGIRHVEMLENEGDHFLRVIQFENNNWQELKELIVADKTSGIIVYRLVDHPYFQGETINICRTTNQVYQSELEYEINWKLKNVNNQESNNDIDIAQQALQLAVNEMKRISEETEAVYQ